MSFAPDTEVVADLRLAQLFAMLRYRRPFASVSEYEFREQFIAPLGPQDMASNLVVRIPHPSGEHSKTLFSCHTDTVHHDGGKQDIVYDAEMQVIYKIDGTPLGADDGAGCFVLLEMIKRGIPGCYVFHTGEEAGGVGSSLMAELEPEFLKQFDRAIAFDRRGTQDVITHQMVGRCCSTLFAQALADALNVANDTFSYGPDDSGTFTDTANYTRLIPECTNLSVGYEGEHSSGEMLDVAHLLALAVAAAKIDWDALPTVRDPEEVDDDFGYGYRGYWGLGLTKKQKRRERKRRRKQQLALANVGSLLKPIGRQYRDQRDAQDVWDGFKRPDEWDGQVVYDDPAIYDDPASPGVRVWESDEGTRYVVDENPRAAGLRLIEEMEEQQAEQAQADEEEQHQLALEAASEFFSVCRAQGLDKAYNSLQMHEVVHFYLDNARSYNFLLEAMQEGGTDDATVMEWVLGY